MDSTLELLQTYIKKLESDSSTLAKTETLKGLLKDKDAADLVWLTYNPYKKFNITSKNCEKLRSKLNSEIISDTSLKGFKQFLNDLADSKITGHAAISRMLGWIYKYPDYQDLLYRIIDKDLKCRTNVSLINKAKGNKWIPEFRVALAEKYKEGKDTIDENWFVSRKLDGVRCLCVSTYSKTQFFSRQGHEFNTLDVIKKDIEKIQKLFGQDFVIDGEICLVDDKGNEDFQGIMKEIRKKNHTIKNPKYKIFDFLTWEEFNEAKSTTIISDRLQRLISFMQDEKFDHIEVLDQLPCNAENLSKMQDKAKNEEWEGLIVRKNTFYKGKRSRDMLKLKKFFDAEYVVKDVELGKMQIVVEGAEREIDCLSAVIIEHKGHKVKVGSGFDVEQRQKYFNNPEEIIGKTICVQYFEQTENQEGGISLRFPTVKHIYENGRDV